jgi:hypothetical protein
MSDGLQTTFEFLAQTPNKAATRVLIPALDSRFRAIRHGALAAILARESPAAHREVIARLHTIDPEQRGLIEGNFHRLSAALRDAIVEGDEQTCANGCQAALWFRQYELVPALLNALEDARGARAEVLGGTLLELVEQLCRELADWRQSGKRRDPRWVREQVVGALELSIRRYGKHRRREVVEALVLLAHRDNDTLAQVLEDPLHPAFVALLDVLSKSPRGPVVRLILSYLEDPKAPSAALSIAARRCDPEFVRHFLRRIGSQPSPAVVQNLKRMGSVAWAHGSAALLDRLDEASQEAAVRLMTLCGTSRANAFVAVGHLLVHGKPAARRAAAEALEQFRGAEANALALEALDDPDPEVQARVVVQLRGRGIPGSLTRVLAMLDSPHAVVRRAARDSLAEFTFPRFLASFDLLDDEVRQSTGELVKKVDPHTLPLLEAEMAAPLRSRRLRGLAIARSLHVVAEVESPIVRLLADENHLIRAEAAAALADCTSMASHDALCAATSDHSPIVREAARKSLAQRARGGVPSSPAAPGQNPKGPLPRLPEERRHEQEAQREHQGPSSRQDEE